MLPTVSVAAFAAMAAGIAGLFYTGALFGPNPVAIAIQALAALLMVWARITFGGRSFHAAADPTSGGIVTSGPYAYVRHPIYAAAIDFVWAGALQHRSWTAAGYAAVVTAGAVVRMLSEEHLLVRRYPAYRDYMRRVKRVVPFVV